jgi:uncharacterized protein YijF (DUF1287 family)
MTRHSRHVEDVARLNPRPPRDEPRLIRGLPWVAGVLAVAVACPLHSNRARADAGSPVGKVTPTATERVVSRARLEVARGVRYDPAYRTLTFRDEIDTKRGVYPNGDVDPSRGVCTDLLTRALRAGGLDLQKAVHEDALKAPRAYPTIAPGTDANIDHRRVAPVLAWMQRHAASLPKGTGSANDLASWRPGDVVVWAFGACPRCNPDHVGIVSDRIGADGVPLVIHNLGPSPTEDHALESWNVLGHFRPLE